jgi:hypothetical protein
LKRGDLDLTAVEINPFNPPTTIVVCLLAWKNQSVTTRVPLEPPIITDVTMTIRANSSTIRSTPDMRHNINLAIRVDSRQSSPLNLNHQDRPIVHGNRAFRELQLIRYNIKAFQIIPPEVHCVNDP